MDLTNLRVLPCAVVNMKFVRIVNYLYQHWKCLCEYLVVIALLWWILWKYQQQAIPTAKFLISSDYRQCEYRRRQYEIEERSSPAYITAAIHGRFGNWMYSYASLLGIARANGYIPYITSSHPINGIFALTRVRNTEAECLHTLYDNFPCSYTSQFMNLPPGNISIEGYIQSWKYFRFMEQEIRNEFKLQDYVRVDAEQDFKSYVGVYVQEDRPVIGIHVRRGDLLRPSTRKLGFCHAPKSYLDNAIKYMLKRYPHAVFFVASDDIAWCMENIVPPELSDVFDSEESLQKASFGLSKTLQDKVPVVFSKARDTWSDFSLLTMCNHSIITVGTFGWWSAWLADGDVVYYKDFPMPGTKIYYQMKKEDYFPEHWVALSGSTVMSGHMFVGTVYSVLVMFLCTCL